VHTADLHGPGVIAGDQAGAATSGCRVPRHGRHPPVHLPLPDHSPVTHVHDHHSAHLHITHSQPQRVLVGPHQRAYPRPQLQPTGDPGREHLLAWHDADATIITIIMIIMIIVITVIIMIIVIVVISMIIMIIAIIVTITIIGGEEA
jgi:hypothetical protein